MRALAIVCALVVGSTAARAERTMKEGDAAFAAALHGQLRAQTGNLFYSPVSVRVALAMAMTGARGATQAELARALSLPSGPEGARAVGAQLANWEALARAGQAQEREQDRISLRVVNRIWAQRGQKLAEDFVQTLRDVYRAPLGAVDFEHDRGGACATINRWVSEATDGLIPALLSPGSLDPDTKMVLTNAVYFKAGWQAPFDAWRTHRDSFFVSRDDVKQVPLMHRVDGERLARVHGALVLERPYSGGRLVMDIILPTAKDGLGAIEDAYVKGALPGWLQALAPAYVDVTMPKLKLSTALSLAPALKGLGVVQATDRFAADFSGVDGKRDFYISLVIHQAVIDVDEVRTEAAAATAIGMSPPTMALQQPPPPIVFRADHPFLFVIRDTDADVVLFAGRVVDPTAR